MPTYDYKCADCDDVLEIVHRIDEAVESCPRCGGRLRRLFHPVGIIFKGSGFYKTDYRSSADNGGNGGPPEKPERELEKAREKSSEKEEKPPRKKEAGA